MDKKNRQRIDRLVKEHGSALVRFLTKRLNNREDAEDIAQNTFIKLYTLEKPENISNVKAFMFQVAANMSVDQLRRKTLMQNYLEEQKSKQDSNSAVADGQHASAERELEAKQKIGHIYQVIESMPPRVREAFVLNRVKGYTYAEIAKIMGVSVSSVEKYMLEAMKQCRRALLED